MKSEMKATCTMNRWLGSLGKRLRVGSMDICFRNRGYIKPAIKR